MKRSEKFYGAAMAVALVIGALADSPNYAVWTVIAVVGLIGAMLLIRAAIKAEKRGK